jgi:predicted metal-dependent hydrolase
MELVSEVRRFLDGLKLDLPELFLPKERPVSTAAPRPLDSSKSVFHARVAHYAPLMGVIPNKIFLKEQRTLWGSCSVRGNLNFNKRLLNAPPEILDYVVIHELAHLRHMNHSRNFWDFVAVQCPEWKARRKWLRLNSTLLAS